MSDARQALADITETAPKPSPKDAQTAAMLASAVTPADPVSEATEDVEIDYDFLNFDPTDCDPYLEAHGLKPDHDNFDYRWANTDPRLFPRTKAKGWEPVESGKVRRNELMLMKMPKKRAKALREYELDLAARRSRGALDRFDAEANQITGGKNFTPFDDASGPRIKR